MPSPEHHPLFDHEEPLVDGSGTPDSETLRWLIRTENGTDEEYERNMRETEEAERAAAELPDDEPIGDVA